MIDFNRPYSDDNCLAKVTQALNNHYHSGDGEFTALCRKWFEKQTGCPACLLTTSGTSALEMAVLLCDIGEGDEVIMPSFTFSSTANAVVRVGAKCVFIDVRPDTMNMDEKKIEAAITSKTKAIMCVHYAGVACEMDEIMRIAREHNLKVIEDAAQGVMSKYKGKALGTIGDFGCFSFHETKNYSMGEGGALLINDPAYIERAEILREKGTNRSKYFRGEIAKYSWVDVGSSFLPSDILAAFLWGQLENADKLLERRMSIWNAYYDGLRGLADEGLIELPVIPEGITHNAHIFFIKTSDLDERQSLIKYLKGLDILTVFHYVPLHSAEAGIKFGRFDGEDKYTTKESERLLRLPMHYFLSDEDVATVVKAIEGFYHDRKRN